MSARRGENCGLSEESSRLISASWLLLHRATSELNDQVPTIPVWQLHDFQMRKYSINGKDTLSLNATASSTIDAHSDADLFSIMKGLIVSHL